MGKLGVARQADEAQDLTADHPVAGANRDAAVQQVAVLGFPAAGMRDDHAVAGFAALDLSPVDVADRDVRPCRRAPP